MGEKMEEVYFICLRGMIATGKCSQIIYDNSATFIKQNRYSALRKHPQ